MVQLLHPSELRTGCEVTVYKVTSYHLGRCLPHPSRPAPSVPCFCCQRLCFLALLLDEVDIVHISAIDLERCVHGILDQFVSALQA